MFGLGLALTPADFARVARFPRAVIVGLLVQTHTGVRPPDEVVALLHHRAGGNPFFLSPVLALAPLRASLDQFDRAGGMAALRTKSEKLTGFLETLIGQRLADTLEIITPAEPAQRGAQLSLRVAGGRARGRELFEYLRDTGILGDWREPDVIRISPAPLYNRYSDVLRFVEEVEHWRGV